MMYSPFNKIPVETGNQFLIRIGKDVIKTAAVTLTGEAVRSAFALFKKKQELKLIRRDKLEGEKEKLKQEQSSAKED